jgi:hypothetical protein
LSGGWLFGALVEWTRIDYLLWVRDADAAFVQLQLICSNRGWRGDFGQRGGRRQGAVGVGELQPADDSTRKLSKRTRNFSYQFLLILHGLLF